VNVDGDVFGINVKNNEENSILVDGNYDTCTAADAIQRETSFGLVFSRQYRIYGVKLIAKEQPGNCYVDLQGFCMIKTTFSWIVT
jgi:hypothetical protein